MSTALLSTYQIVNLDAIKGIITENGIKPDEEMANCLADFLAKRDTVISTNALSPLRSADAGHVLAGNLIQDMLNIAAFSASPDTRSLTHIFQEMFTTVLSENSHLMV